jgi:ubiquinone/menaquinone biosynthesis C-methylase UbiE
MLSHEAARRVYDRIGAWQDSQAFYEDRVTAVLLSHGEFASAHSVFEFGCGTGRFAHELLEKHLPRSARYRGVDLSPKMISLAQARLAPYGARAEVMLTAGAPPTAEPTAAYDRFVSNFVFDLLSEDDIHAVVREAQRMLTPGGLLCLASLSTGSGPVSRAVARLWGWIQALQPSVVGGCRPVELLPLLSDSQWDVRQHARVVAYAIPSEAIVAQRR